MKMWISTSHLPNWS